VYLLLERPFRVGDTIRVRDQEGVVENIGVRTTSLRTPDNVYVLVPNMIVFAEVVANRSHAQPGHPATAGADGAGAGVSTGAQTAQTPQASQAAHAAAQTGQPAPIQAAAGERQTSSPTDASVR